YQADATVTTHPPPLESLCFANPIADAFPVDAELIRVPAHPDQKRLAHQVFRRYRPPKAAIAAPIAIITHNEIAALRHDIAETAVGAIAMDDNRVRRVEQQLAAQHRVRSLFRPPIGPQLELLDGLAVDVQLDRKSTRLNSSHVKNSYAVFCLKKKETLSGRLREAAAGRPFCPQYRC